MVINLWSSPRNVSTALMYSFAQRPDTRVWDEPLYGHYLRVSGADHPGREEILASMETDGNKVVEQLILAPHDCPVCFFKQMTHHLVDLDPAFLEKCENVLLIRDPAAFITSYAKVIPNPSLEDVGVRQQWELFEHLAKRGHLAAVLDARQLLLDPTKVLSQLCERLELPFFPEMLYWEPGPRPEDGVWAPYWYGRVHQSSGFQPYVDQAVEVPNYLQALVQEANTYYQALFTHALKA